MDVAVLTDFLGKLVVLALLLLLAAIIIFSAIAGIAAVRNNQTGGPQGGVSIARNAIETNVWVIVLVAVALSPVLVGVFFWLFGASMPTLPSFIPR